MDIKVIKEEFAKLHEETTAIVSESDKRELTADELASKDEKFSKMDKLDAQIKDAEKLAKYNFDNKTVKIVTPAKSQAQVAFETSEVKNNNTVMTAENFDRAGFSVAFNDWARTGYMDERFATITTASNSGVLLPKIVGAPLVPIYGNQIRQGLNLNGLTVVSTPGTAELNLPISLSAVGTDLSETASSSPENSTDATTIIKNVNLKCFAIESGQVPVSNLELAANEFDLLSAIAPGLEDAKEMRLEQRIFAAIKADGAISQAVLVSSDPTDATSDDLFDANNGFASSRFNRFKCIFLSTEAYAAYSAVKGTDGHPIFLPDPQNQSLLRCQGTPVLRTDFLDAYGAHHLVGVVISFVGFKLRDAGPGTKYIRFESQTKTDQTILNAVGYHAYGYVVDSIVKIVTGS